MIILVGMVSFIQSREDQRLYATFYSGAFSFLDKSRKSKQQWLITISLMRDVLNHKWRYQRLKTIKYTSQKWCHFLSEKCKVNLIDHIIMRIYPLKTLRSPLNWDKGIGWSYNHNHDKWTINRDSNFTDNSNTVTSPWLLKAVWGSNFELWTKESISQFIAILSQFIAILSLNSQ